jgi:hypothetical protein
MQLCFSIFLLFSIYLWYWLIVALYQMGINKTEKLMHAAYSQDRESSRCERFANLRRRAVK